MNSFDEVDPKLVDVMPAQHDGYPEEERLKDLEPGVLRFAAGATARDFPTSWEIDPKDWPDWARENDKNHTWGLNYLDRFTNQNPTHECTCHSLRANMEAARNRHRGIKFPEGPKKGYRYPDSARGSVWLSPMSVYNEANPGIRGGAGIRQVLEIAARRGMLPETMQPADYGFKHAIPGTMGEGNTNQSHGDWVSVSKMPNGWQETAKLFMPKEIIFPDSWEQAVCLVLRGVLVGVGRSGHAISWAQCRFSGNNFNGYAYPDSYDIVRYDSLSVARSAWQGSFAVVTVETPNDWDDPANIGRKAA